MSFENFEKALELAKICDGYWIAGGKTDEVIQRGEELMGFKFSKQTHEFFKRIGKLMLFGEVIYGISKNDFSGMPAHNSIEFTLLERKEWKLPKEWLAIYNFDDGYRGFLDYGNLNADGEPPVVMAICNGKEYVMVERVAEDLGDFILELVEEQLKYQTDKETKEE